MSNSLEGEEMEGKGEEQKSDAPTAVAHGILMITDSIHHICDSSLSSMPTWRASVYVAPHAERG